jgi:hypothetical protein
MGLRNKRIKPHIIAINKMASSAFHTQYSTIPLFHHSMWHTEENSHQKNNNFSAAAG